jgi:hypothetical protein
MTLTVNSLSLSGTPRLLRTKKPRMNVLFLIWDLILRFDHFDHYEYLWSNIFLFSQSGCDIHAK